MKKLLFAAFMMAIMSGAILVATPVTASAQKQYTKRVMGSDGRYRWVRVRKPTFYRRHRNRVNMAVGTGAGAIIGGLVGGRRGAAIGAGAGLGGSALYTYKLRPKKRHYRKVRRY